MTNYAYEHRFYRDWTVHTDLCRFEVVVGQSDLLISATRNLQREALETLTDIREQIETHISSNEPFLTSHKAIPVPADAPEVIAKMATSAAQWRVGPMAAVAGAVAQAVGQALCAHSQTIIVENGGDVYAKSEDPLNFGLYAGRASPFTNKIKFQVDASDGVGVCTSSGRVGPSTSYGRADAVVAIARDAALADAAATSIANQIKQPEDVSRVVNQQASLQNLSGLIACCADQIGFWGDIELLTNRRSA